MYNLAADDVAEAFATGREQQSLDVGGKYKSGGKPPVTEGDQALKLRDLFLDFESECDGIGVQCDLIIEDWQPRLPLRSGERVVFYPVRIPATLIGLLYENGWVPVEWQQPGSVKNFATDKRLRRWDKWVRGSDHQRDAWRHVASRLNALLG